jgi:hypothetical protein
VISGKSDLPTKYLKSLVKYFCIIYKGEKLIADRLEMGYRVQSVDEGYAETIESLVV